MIRGSLMKGQGMRDHMRGKKGYKRLCLSPRSLRGPEWPTFCRPYSPHLASMVCALGQCCYPSLPQPVKTFHQYPVHLCRTQQVDYSILLQNFAYIMSVNLKSCIGKEAAKWKLLHNPWNWDRFMALQLFAHTTHVRLVFILSLVQWARDY